jgi:hypothetical protein
MKNKILVLASLAASVMMGCTTTKTSVTPASGTNAAVTNVTTTTQGIDPATVQAVDAQLQVIVNDTPAALAIAQTVSAMVHSNAAPSAVTSPAPSVKK